MFSNELWNKPASAGYTIDQSCRFDRSDQSYLTQDFGSVTAAKWTVSVWLKRATVSYDFSVIVGRTDGGTALYFTSSNILETATHQYHRTSASYSSTSLWYHIVWNQATQTQSYCWVNGVAQTITTSGGYGPWFIPWHSSSTVGNLNGTGYTRFFDGLMADLYGIYNQDLDQDDFGEFNGAGEWVPKDASSDITFGSNDYYLTFADSSNLGLDSSGQSNNWTVNNMGSDHQVTDDTPTT
tara:strand:+ start:49 stop:765 length:717 start_codon:yes stop_codon:yes gene_type:complete